MHVFYKYSEYFVSYIDPTFQHTFNSFQHSFNREDPENSLSFSEEKYTKFLDFRILQSFNEHYIWYHEWIVD